MNETRATIASCAHSVPLLINAWKSKNKMHTKRAQGDEQRAEKKSWKNAYHYSDTIHSMV